MKIKVKTDEEISEEARIKFREMMFRKSLMERGEPLLKELTWVVKGRQNEAEHEKILPDYCYNIFELLKRTIFQVIPTFSEVLTVTDKDLAASAQSIEDAKEVVRLDWEKFGSVIGAGIRCVRFCEIEAEEKLKQDGLLNLEKHECEDLMKWVFGSEWIERKTAEISAQNPGKPIEETLVAKAIALKEFADTSISKWNGVAYQWGPEAMTLLNKGIARGMSGLLDEKGTPAGEGKLKVLQTYVFLSIGWPEIQEMISADPPKTRNDLWDWLTPFSHAKWIEINDLDKLNWLCEFVKLKLKKPGAPRKEK